MEPFYTIGMACFDDHRRPKMTIQAMRAYFQSEAIRAEFIIVNNNPVNKWCSRELENFANNIPNCRYIAMDQPKGTTAPRQRIFDEAKGKWVMCVDSHILLLPPGLPRLTEFLAKNSMSNDLYQGPLFYDSFMNISTHFDDIWGAEMWGKWGQAWKCNCEQTYHGTSQPALIFSVQGSDDTPEARAVYYSLEIPTRIVKQCPRCSQMLPVTKYYGHQEILKGWYRPLGGNPDDPPFEIPGQGLGVFLCRREAWPGFNPHFREFGGEEMYIHEKFRQRGDKCWCLPFMPWWHDFEDPELARRASPTSAYGKARNYVLGFQELGRPVDKAHEIFVPASVSPGDWAYLMEDPVAHERRPNSVVKTADGAPPPAPVRWGRPQPPAGCSLDEAFFWCIGVPRDLDKHMLTLRHYAGLAEHATEFSKRRESTLGLLAGRPTTLVSYQTELDEIYERYHEFIGQPNEAGRKTVTFQHTVGPEADSLVVRDIEPTDMLYMDTVHHGERLADELKRFGPSVRKFIMLRGTGAFGDDAEGGGPGLWPVIRDWVDENPAWYVIFHAANEYGITVLSRVPELRPSVPITPWPKGAGPGTELSLILKDLKINPGPACDCRAKARQMDDWGVEECRKQKDLIVGWMREGMERWGWADRLKAGALAVLTGLAFKLNVTDPFPDLIEEAICRAEAKEKQT
jgi:hypothetical protein